MSEHYDDAIVDKVQYEISDWETFIAADGMPSIRPRQPRPLPDIARAVLDAVAGEIAARTLEEAAEECEALDWGMGGHSDVWAIRGAWLRDRADRLREGGDRG